MSEDKLEIMKAVDTFTLSKDYYKSIGYGGCLIRKVSIKVIIDYTKGTYKIKNPKRISGEFNLSGDKVKSSYYKVLAELISSASDFVKEKLEAHNKLMNEIKRVWESIA